MSATVNNCQLWRVDMSRLLEDHSTASSVHSQALTTLQEKLQRAEMNAARDNEHHQQVQKEYLERQSKLESEMRTLAETVESLQKKLQEEKSKLCHICIFKISDGC